MKVENPKNQYFPKCEFWRHQMKKENTIFEV